ncbi:MAG: Rpn family recombination-promoting nuclease/putative transposase [Nostoc sp.]|uniref:Rpn family recombination-promoting nuclease/putative transposase n=1 Tax=Nostoc sp. TaxID=1180 RepID=UPI002FF78639
MKTDSIFYRLFQEFPSIFFELIGNPPETANTYQFASVEIKQTAFRIDGVFLPIQDEESPIYFVEVQFQPDTEIYLRLVSEISLYLRQNRRKNPWRGVVIYPSRDIDIGEKEDFIEFFHSQRISRIYLDELGSAASLPIGIATIKLVIEDEDTAINSAKELINRTQQAVNLQLPQKQLLELIETILVYKFVVDFGSIYRCSHEITSFYLILLIYNATFNDFANVLGSGRISSSAKDDSISISSTC